MSIDAATFRLAMGQWPSGVTVVTTVVDGVWHGMTASAFSSVSLDPPLVSVCISRAVSSHDRISSSQAFAVNILAKDQVDLGKRFAGMLPGVEDRFDGLGVTTAVTGCPLLPNVLAWLDCTVRNAYDGGDHTIFVGEVRAAEAARTAPPLLYHSRVWGQFADVLPDEVTLIHGSRDLSPVSIVAEPPAAAPSASHGVVLVDTGGATPVQVRDCSTQLLLLTRPAPVALRLDPENPFVQANLLAALRSGVTRIVVGEGALDEQSVRAFLAALEIAVHRAG